MFKEILGEAFPIIEKVAPTVATVLGTPTAGMATSFALSLIGKALGIDSTNIQAMARAVVSQPNASDKLADVESTFSTWIKSQNPRLPSKAEINIKLEWETQDQTQ